jgi:uncharacterized protein
MRERRETPDAGERTMTTKTAIANTAIVHAAYTAFATGDIPALLAQLTDDVSWAAPATLPHGGRFTGRKGVVEFFTGLGSQWASLQLNIESVADVAPDTVVGIVKAVGERTSGESGGYGAVHVFTIRDGRICAFREFTDLDAPMA